MCHLQLGKKVKHGTLDIKMEFFMIEIPKKMLNIYLKMELKMFCFNNFNNLINLVAIWIDMTTLLLPQVTLHTRTSLFISYSYGLASAI